MDTDHLLRMANRIGDFFVAMPDRAEAERGVADHLHKFWEPRMRRQFLAMIDAGQAEGLHEIVAAAVRDHRAELEPTPAPAPTSAA